MPKYMLLLHDNPSTSTFASMSPEQMQKAIEKYVAWGQKLRTLGILLASDKLTDEPGRVMRGRNGHVRVTDGPFSETKEVLGGYYLINAASYDEAIDRARDCPQLEYGGTIEVRQVDEMKGE
jgi:hypothetical protein